MNLDIFRRKYLPSDAFEIVAAPAVGAPVVGAPHHGVRPNVDADRATGPIALALAQRLEGRAVVVHDLRRMVDVNKDPLGLERSVRHYALRYQNEMFGASDGDAQQPGGFPAVVIEVHGHTSGRYDVEISSGFDLDPLLAADRRFLEKLSALRAALPAAFASRIGWKPSLGVFPIDRDVKKPATNTFTFQKIRRLRQQTALEIYGLHIELNAELRTSRRAQAPGYLEALSDALAAPLRAIFTHPSEISSPLSSPSSAVSGVSSSVCGPSPLDLKVLDAPQTYAEQRIVLVHPEDLAELGAIEGDTGLLRNKDEETRATLIASRTVPVGSAALPARLRRQIGLELRQRVTVCQAVKAPAAPANGNPPAALPSVGSAPYSSPAGISLALAARRPVQPSVPEACLWVSPQALPYLNLAERVSVTFRPRPEQDETALVTVLADAGLSPRLAAASEALMDRYWLTLGDVIRIKV